MFIEATIGQRVPHNFVWQIMRGLRDQLQTGPQLYPTPFSTATGDQTCHYHPGIWRTWDVFTCFVHLRTALSGISTQGHWRIDGSMAFRSVLRFLIPLFEENHLLHPMQTANADIKAATR